MKKLFVMGAIALAGLMSAQTAKGGWVINGKTNLDFTSTSVKYKANGKSVDGPTLSKFDLGAGVGYFVMDNLSVGLDATYNSTTAKEGNTSVTSSLYSVLPTATYYFGTTELRPYLGAGVGFGGDDNNTGFAWDVKGGLVYLLNNTVGVNAGLEYGQVSIENNNVTRTAGGLGVNAGLSIFL